LQCFLRIVLLTAFFPFRLASALPVLFFAPTSSRRGLPSFPTRRSSDLGLGWSMAWTSDVKNLWAVEWIKWPLYGQFWGQLDGPRSEEHTSELQSRVDLVCRLRLEKKKGNDQKREREGANASERCTGERF